MLAGCLDQVFTNVQQSALAHSAEFHNLGFAELHAFSPLQSMLPCLYIVLSFNCVLGSHLSFLNRFGSITVHDMLFVVCQCPIQALLLCYYY